MLQDRDSQVFDVVKWRWHFIIIMCALASIIFYYKENPFKPVHCSSSKSNPEVRIFFPPPTNPANQLQVIFSRSNM